MKSAAKSRRIPWSHARIPAPAAAEDAIAALCLELGAPGVQTGKRDLRRVALTPRPPRQICIEAWFPPAVSRRHLRRALTTGLRRVHEAFPGVDPGRLTIEAFDVNQDADRWRDDFPALRIGRRFLVAPPWSDTESGARLRIVIDPGQAFGTGHHSTTRGCLLAIEEECSRRKLSRGLDVGCGSGVLAIALRKLGVPQVVAIDTDPLAISATEKATRENDCHPVRVGDRLARARGQYDLVVANLYSRTLVKLAKMLSNRLKPGGRLIVSGLLEKQEKEVRAAFREQLLRVYRRRSIATWVTLTLGHDTRRQG